jgi:galectin-4
VNFAVGQDDGADVAFHFNPRFDGWDKVVFNTMQSGQWGKEEKKKSMPFQKGKHFELVFMVMPEHYKVGASPSLPAAPSLPVALLLCLKPSLSAALPPCSLPTVL